MSYEVANAEQVLGPFASNLGYDDLIHAVNDGSPVLQALFKHGATEDVFKAVEELRKLEGSEDVVTTANALADLIDGQELVIITDGTSDDDEDVLKNDCHVPSGPKGGQFCSTGGAGVPKLTYVGSASHMGGAKPKDLYKDEQGNKWMFKPSSDAFRAHVEQSASEIARMVNPNAVEVYATTLGGKFGSVQKLVPNVAPKSDFRGTDLTKLDQKSVRQIQQEHVIDWLTSQHDSHPGQFVRTSGGEVLGIDKSQAYKHIGSDRLSINYHPNVKYGETEPIYNTMGRLAQQGKLKLDPQAVAPAIRRAEGILDAALHKTLKPYAESVFPGNKSAQSNLYKLASARRDSLRSDFEKYYSGILGQPVTIAKSSISDLSFEFGKNECHNPAGSSVGGQFCSAGSGGQYKAGSAKDLVHSYLSDGAPHNIYAVAGVVHDYIPGVKVPHVLWNVGNDGKKLIAEGKDGWVINKAGHTVKMTKVPAGSASAHGQYVDYKPTPKPAPTPTAPKAPVSVAGKPTIDVNTHYKPTSVQGKIVSLLSDGKPHSVKECTDIAKEAGHKWAAKPLSMVKIDGEKNGAWTINKVGSGANASVRLVQTGATATGNRIAPIKTVSVSVTPLATPKVLPESAFKELSHSALVSHANVVWGNLGINAKAGALDYTGAGHHAVNKLLRAGEFNPNKQSKTTGKVLGTDAAVNSWKTPDDIVVWRGCSGCFGEGKASVGSIVTDRGFISTAIDKGHAWSGTVAAKILVPRGTPALPVGPKGASGDEREILLPRGSRFEVVASVSEMSGHSKLVLRLIPGV